MLKLIKLENKKFRISGYLKGVIIANLIILGLLFISAYQSKVNRGVTFSTYKDVFLSVSIFVKGIFPIFAAVLISRLIIGEYVNKTINVLFTYPISRKKIMLAKLAVVLIFTFTAIVISSLFLSFSLFLLNIFINFIQDSLTVNILVKNLINIIVYSVAFAFVSIIPVYVGMRKKSGPATIITSIILVAVLNSGNKGNTLSSIMIMTLILAIIGSVTSYLSIKDVEKEDMINS